MALVALVLCRFRTPDGSVNLAFVKITTSVEMTGNTAGIVAVIVPRMAVQARHGVRAGTDWERHMHIRTLPFPVRGVMADFTRGAGDMIRHVCECSLELVSMAPDALVGDHVIGV